MNSDQAPRVAVAILDQLDRLGIDPPDNLARLVATHQAARAYVTAPPPNLRNAANLTPETVADLIAEAVEARMRAEATQPAVREVLAAIGGAIRAELGRTAVNIIESMKKTFTDDAGRFAEVHVKLPRGWEDAANIVAAGPEATRDFTEASRLAARMDLVRSVRMNLPGPTFGADANRGSAFAIVGDNLQAQQAHNLAGSGGIAFWGALLAVDGCTGLELRTGPEADDYLEALPKMFMAGEPVGDGLHTRYVKRPVGGNPARPTVTRKPVLNV